MLIGDILRRSAEPHGDKPALICEDRTLSFNELDTMADQFAAALAAAGLQVGDCVTLYGENSWEWVVSYYGIARAGCVINPVNALLTWDELAFIVEDCGSRMIVTSAAKILTAPARTIPFVIYGGETAGRGSPFGAFLENGAKRGFVSEQRALPADLSTLCYTSGTTGQPKGAMLSHATVVTNTRMTALMHGRRESDIVVSALPCPHVYGNIVLNASILSGATLILFPRFDASQVIDAIMAHRATMFEGVPTMYHYLLDAPALEGADLSSLRICSVGGQTMAKTAMENVERAFGCPLIELWGMTELGGLGTTHPHTGPRRPGSIGITLPFMDARIGAHDDPGVTLATDEPGELLLRGPLVMLGYHKNAAATAETITPDGWLRTGDIAFRDSDGFFHVVDRKKDMILTAGYNIYPAEVERAIASHSSVAMVAVAAVADQVKGEVPHAYIVLKTGHRADSAAIIAHCRTVLAPYKIPRGVSFVADLPTTSTGKIMRRALRYLGAHDVPSQGENV